MGYFITLEGIDGAGKSTALTHVKNALEKSDSKTIVVTREPGGSALAEKIRELLLSSRGGVPMPPVSELLLMYAARADHLARVIGPALTEGKIVLCDRFDDATFAYQGAGRGLPAEWIEALRRWVLGTIKPNLTFLFDLPVKAALERRRSEKDTVNRFDEERLDFFERVREGYLGLAKKEPKRFRVIDASRAREDVLRQIDMVLRAERLIR